MELLLKDITGFIQDLMTDLYDDIKKKPWLRPELIRQQ